MAEKQKKLLGRYIVADPKICHGKPTFRGTRIMVWQVLNQLANGKSWDAIIAAWGGAMSAKKPSPKPLHFQNETTTQSEGNRT